MHEWLQTSPYVFRDRNFGGSIIGTMDDFGNIVAVSVSDIVQFHWDFA
jgi:acyl-CoA hydrolase